MKVTYKFHLRFYLFRLYKKWIKMNNLHWNLVTTFAEMEAGLVATVCCHLGSFGNCDLDWKPIFSNSNLRMRVSDSFSSVRNLTMIGYRFLALSTVRANCKVFVTNLSLLVDICCIKFMASKNFRLGFVDDWNHDIIWIIKR